MSDIILTPSALLGFLSQVEELTGKEITFSETEDELTVTIGDSQYILDASNAPQIEIDKDSLDQIEDANEDGYDQLDEDQELDIVDIQGDEPVEGGIIKELIKTLAVGGLVRLTKDAIMQS